MMNTNMLIISALCISAVVSQMLVKEQQLPAQPQQQNVNGGHVQLNSALLQLNSDNCYGSCLSCNPQNIAVCYVCNVGFVLMPNGGCMQCPPGCVTCQGRTMCTECLPGYSLVRQFQTGLCMRCGVGCEQCFALPITNGYLMQLTTCNDCFPGFYQSKAVSQYPIYQCIPCLPGCYKCTNNVSCSQCVNGFGYYAGNNTCTACPTEHCSSCMNGSCLRCNPGYYLIINNITDNTDNECAACSLNCITCQSYDYCSNCRPGYFVNKENDTSYCQQCVMPCIACKNLTVCLACTGSYYLQMSLTNQTLPQIEQSYCVNCTANCYKCVDNNTCIQCLAYYYLNSAEQCSPCVSPCLQCVSNTKCTSCIDSHYLNFTQCRHCGQNCAFCQTIVIQYYIQVVCLACLSNLYALLADKCQLCIQVTNNCVTCLSPAICLSCADGYQLVDSQCHQEQQGLGAVYIVLFCIAGLIALGAIGFAVWACWRHRNGYGSANNGDSGVRSSYLQIP